MYIPGSQIICTRKNGNVMVCANQSLTEAPTQVLAHQTNCMGVMGRGVAIVLRQAFPEIFPPYQALCKTSNPLGTTQLVALTGAHQYERSPSLYVANIFGQYHYGTDSRKTEYTQQSKALQHLREQMMNKGLDSVAFPINMGCVLAGGDWTIVLPNILEAFAQSGIQLIFSAITGPTAPAVQQTCELLRSW